MFKTMLEICNKKIEVSNPDLLTSKFAIYIVELEYDNRVYVGHTIMLSVKSDLRKFINSVLDGGIKHNVLLKESMKLSDTLYVSIKEPAEYTLDALFKLKYDTIIACGSYEPYGFNKICMIGNKYEEEKKYIRLVKAKIGNIYEKVPMASNAKTIAEYSYNIIAREYVKVAEWPSITAAARHYSLNASNIAACCTGRLNSAYGRIWRYID